MELFRQLPGGVQRQASRYRARCAPALARLSRVPQVWELDNALFIRHATPSVLAYAEETATLLRELDMVCPRARLPRPRVLALTRLDGWHAELRLGCHSWAGWRRRSRPLLHRQAWRRCREAIACAAAQGTAQRQRQRPASRPTGACALPQPCGSSYSDAGAARCTLHRKVGGSARLYTCVVRICRQNFASSGVVATCTLRSQLLMALHDASTLGNAAAYAFKEVCEPDKCHKLAWLLDACLKVRTFPFPEHARAQRHASMRYRTATAISGGLKRSAPTWRRWKRRRKQLLCQSDLQRSSGAAALLRARIATEATAWTARKMQRCQTS